jgi:hypothetical protein
MSPPSKVSRGEFFMGHDIRPVAQQRQGGFGTSKVTGRDREGETVDSFTQAENQRSSSVRI